MSVNIQTTIFNPAARTLDFSAWTSPVFDIRQISAVYNKTRDVFIYMVGSATTGYTTFAANVMTLAFDTTTHNAGDTLSVYFSSSETVLPTGASTAAKQDIGNTSLDNIQTSFQDTYIIGQAGQTAVINNILPTVAGADGTDVLGYGSFSIQVISTATGGTYIFEASNDNVNYSSLPVTNPSTTTGSLTVSNGFTATVSSITYAGSLLFRYIRLRILTTITGGTIQARTILFRRTYNPISQIISQDTAGSLKVQASYLASASLPLVTAANLNSPQLIADIISSGISTTTTTTSFTPTFGTTYEIQIPVTVVTGTNPTLDIIVQESKDNGNVWIDVFHFPRITTTGSYSSGVMSMRGTRVRYIQTISGTTPSFTRAINRLQCSDSLSFVNRQFLDRTISLTTLNATTALFNIQNSYNIQLLITLTTATTPPAIQLEGTIDGVNFFNIGSPLTGIANSTVSLSVANINANSIRAKVSTIGNTIGAGYYIGLRTS